MALSAIPGVDFTPSATKTPTPQNYLGSADFNWLQQYLPETYNKIHERFGSQDITGMLEMQGKEIPFASDAILWKEENRLEQLGTGVTRTGDVFTLASHTYRPGEIIKVRNDDGSVIRKGRIASTTSTTFTALCGDVLGWTAVGTTTLTVFANTDEFLKGSAGMQESLNTTFKSYEQKPVIFKEMVSENRSNMALIVWLDINMPNGETKHVWYFENYKNTEKRFKNKIESGLIDMNKWTGDLATAGYQGTQGLFDIYGEGNVYSGLLTTMAGVDEVVDRSNKQGMISDNFIYGRTAFNSKISDFLSSVNTTGLSWGQFNNDEKMALNLEFSGFKRGGYEFAYSRWRYLDNPTGEGSVVGANKVHAIMFPSGSKQVYDSNKGVAATQPLLHVRYRAYGSMNRKYELSVFDWAAGTSTTDTVKTEFQCEKALVQLGRNSCWKFMG